MSKTASPEAGPKAPRILSIITVILGAAIFVIGCVTYGFTAFMMDKQHVTVLAVTADDPGPLAFQPVKGPFTALATAHAINIHVSEATGGLTYGQIPQVATSDGETYNADVTAAKSTDGQAHTKGSPLSASDLKTYNLRKTAEEGAFLQASLLVSVLAFGVAAFIIGIGLVIAFLGVVLLVIVRGGKPGKAVPAAPSASAPQVE